MWFQSLFLRLFYFLILQMNFDLFCDLFQNQWVTSYDNFLWKLSLAPRSSICRILGTLVLSPSFPPKDNLPGSPAYLCRVHKYDALLKTLKLFFRHYDKNWFCGQWARRAGCKTKLFLPRGRRTERAFPRVWYKILYHNLKYNYHYITLKLIL